MARLTSEVVKERQEKKRTASLRETKATNVRESAEKEYQEYPKRVAGNERRQPTD